MTKAKTRLHWGNHSDKQGRTKDSLIDASMRHVVFDGFSDKALVLAAEESTIEEAYALSLFPDIEADMIGWHSMLGDTRMVEAYDNLGLHDDLRVHERIKTLIMLRFEQNISDREAIRIAMRKLVYPRNSALSFRLLARTCDAVWSAAGDLSTDWNFYSKRGLLGAVYSSTLPVWLDDETEDLQATEEFLLRRLGNVLEFGKFSSRLKPTAENFFDIVVHPFRFLSALSRYAADKSRF